MQIAVIHPGDTVFMLAEKYGVKMERIISVNGLSQPERLVVGQALLIPTTTETQTGKRIIVANAYLQPSTPERDAAIVRATANALTYFSLFQYRALRTGEISALKDQPALQAISNTNARAMMVLANFEEGNFSPEIAHAIFTNQAVKERLINNVVTTMRSKGYRALNVDFENLFPADRELYNQFLRDITARIHREGWKVSTALAPKTSATQKGSWYEAHDYKAHGEIVDFVIIMTYEWGWSGGPPMAVAPIPQVRAVLDYAVTEIPRYKIMMGAPLYGYDWTLPFVKGGPFAQTLSPQAAIDQAARVNARIEYDPVAQAPYYRYYDQQGREHIVWFEDARSMQAKFDLIRQYRLDGISYWVLGNPFPQNWVMLVNQFTIRKV